MNKYSIHRNEEAVSSAIATVLLFGGVVAIVAAMMVTMVPVINELHGSVERNSMSIQMIDYALDQNRLAENGMPGDGTEYEFNPIEGKLNWEMDEGGTWYSASWYKGNSLSIRDAMNFDREFEFKYPAGEISGYCVTDLRVSDISPWIYRVPADSGKILMSPSPSLSAGVKDVQINVKQSYSELEPPNGSSYEIMMGHSEISVIDVPEGEYGETWIKSNSPLSVIWMKENSGATTLSPANPDSRSGEGRYWKIPILEGNTSIHLVSKSGVVIDWQLKGLYGKEVNVNSVSTNTHTTWSKTFSSETPELLEISTSQDSRLMIVRGDKAHDSGLAAGSTPWPDINGTYMGTKFIPPSAQGSLLFTNPSESPITVQWEGVSNSVGVNGILRVPWPPVENSVDSYAITASGSIQLHWLADSAGSGAWRPGSISQLHANDTGRKSGHSIYNHMPSNGGSSSSPESGEANLIIQVAGSNSIYNISDTEYAAEHEEEATEITLASQGDFAIIANNTQDPVSAIITAGNSGMTEILHDGSERCIALKIRASGWISATLPWERSSENNLEFVKNSWAQGSHPDGIMIEVFGETDHGMYTPLANVWGFYMPSLVYKFDSSISGLEVTTKGGVVMTNHPERYPKILLGPESRDGPGERLAASIPLVVPTDSSIYGSSSVISKIEIDNRIQHSSSMAWDVRRGWEGDYSEAIAVHSAKDLAYSSDWTAFPGQINLLSDYMGWIHTSDGINIYHTQGKPIQFNLQSTSMTYDAKEVSG